MSSEDDDDDKKKVVLVCTNGAYLKDHATGLWLEECSSPYYQFLNAGFDVEIASPSGGCIPIDAASMRGDFFVASAKKFMHDAEAIDKLHHSIPLSDIEFPGNVDALYLAAGHGTCVDFVDAPDLKKAIETMYAADKIVAAVCHAPNALVQCKDEKGEPLVKGKNVTGFSDSEEDAVQLSDAVPFMLETELKKLGAKYEKGDDWNSKVCVDGNLITGQNPQSSDECAKAVVDKLKPKPPTPPPPPPSPPPKQPEPTPAPAPKAKPETTPTPRNSVAATSNDDDNIGEVSEDGVVFC